MYFDIVITPCISMLFRVSLVKAKAYTYSTITPIVDSTIKCKIIVNNLCGVYTFWNVHEMFL